MRNCLNCGEPLDGLRRDALYCRTACRVAAHRERRDRVSATKRCET